MKIIKTCTLAAMVSGFIISTGVVSAEQLPKTPTLIAGAIGSSSSASARITLIIPKRPPADESTPGTTTKITAKKGNDQKKDKPKKPKQ